MCLELGTCIMLCTYYHHHNPVTVPGPQCCDHLLGGGALYTVHTVQCTVVSSLCRVTLDSCGADVRLFSHNSQCSVLAPQPSDTSVYNKPGLIQFIIRRCLLTSIYRVTPDSDHVDTG